MGTELHWKDDFKGAQDPQTDKDSPDTRRTGISSPRSPRSDDLTQTTKNVGRCGQ